MSTDPAAAPTTSVLVVDDEAGVRQALRRALILGGYDVVLAEDGQAALDHLALNRPDAVLLDVSMPRIDGLEVCRRLRAAGDRTPVLMLTARDAVDDRVEGLDAGADDYLVKPFALEELKARLRALLRRVEEDGDRPGCASPASSSIRGPTRSAGTEPCSSSPGRSTGCWSSSWSTRARC